MDHDTLEEKDIWIFMDNQAAVQGLLKAAPCQDIALALSVWRTRSGSGPLG
jgi:hypothetical protein